MKNTIMRILLTGLIIASFTPQYVGAQDDFEAWQKQDQASFEQYSAAQTKAYEDFMKADQKAFNQFKKDIEAKWNDFMESDKNTWVEYSPDKTTRTAVDFDKGVAKVEVLVTQTEAKNPKLVESKVSEAVATLVTEKGTTKDYTSPVEKPKPLATKPVLQNQVKTAQGQTVTPQNAKTFAAEVVKAAPPKQEPVVGKDKEKRVKVTVTFPLAPDHFKTRAKELSGTVTKYADKYDLSPELVYAVIHTESAFNPKATSHIPAYGLMQIVPKFAGRDAHLLIYNKDGIPQPNFLYEGQNNIMMGAAYLHILETRYWKEVKDPKVRELCVIASYNTGAGNVAKAFSGTTSPKKAIPKINSMSYDQAYRMMKSKLPYKETQDYIERVSGRLPLYKN